MMTNEKLISLSLVKLSNIVVPPVATIKRFKWYFVYNVHTVSMCTFDPVCIKDNPK